MPTIDRTDPWQNPQHPYARTLHQGATRMVIFREKHVTRYFLCPNLDTFGRIALKVIKERMDPKYAWYIEPNDLPIPEPAYTAEEAGKLREPYRAQALQDLKTYERVIQKRNEEVAFWDLIQKAVAGDRVAAVKVLQARRDHQYETFEFEEIETA